MNWNKWVRQTHRWLSIAFTVAVIVNGVAVFRGRYARWEGLLAVFPLAACTCSCFLMPSSGAAVDASTERATRP